MIYQKAVHSTTLKSIQRIKTDHPNDTGTSHPKIDNVHASLKYPNTGPTKPTKKKQ